MASVLLYPIVYGMELFLASALSTQIAISLAAVLVSTAAVIYCQRTVALWWSLKSTTTHSRAKVVKAHATVEVTEVKHQPTTDRPPDRGGGQVSSREPGDTEKPITSQRISPSFQPPTQRSTNRGKLSDDSEGSTEGSTNGEETETRKKKSASGSKDISQQEQSWLTRQPAAMHRSHWVAKTAQRNPPVQKLSLLRRASADNNGHHRVSEFTREGEAKRREEDASQDANDRGEKPQKPTLDRRSSFPSSLPSATYAQPSRTLTSSSLVTTSPTSSSTSSSTGTPSCSATVAQSPSHDHEEITAKGDIKQVPRDIKKGDPPTTTVSSVIGGVSTLTSVSVMAPATIREESEPSGASGETTTDESAKKVVPKLSLPKDVSTRFEESNKEGKLDKRNQAQACEKAEVMPIICVEPESDKSDNESHSQILPERPGRDVPSPTRGSPVRRHEFIVTPVLEEPPIKKAPQDQSTRTCARPPGPERKDSLGIPTVMTGEIAYPGARRKRPTRTLSEPLTITVQPPGIYETEQAKDQNITKEVIRPIPQRSDSLGIPPVITGEVSFPMKQSGTSTDETTDHRTIDSSRPSKPPGARRKESLEVPSVETGEVSFPPVSDTTMRPPFDRSGKRHRPHSLDIPSLSASLPSDPSSTELSSSVSGVKRKHVSILKHGSSQDKCGRKKSVTFSPTVSPHEFAPDFLLEHESDGAIYDTPKRPKMFRHYSMDGSESSYRKERYRASGRQFADAGEVGILFTGELRDISGGTETASDNDRKIPDDDSTTPSQTDLAMIESEETMHQHTSEPEESDDVFHKEAAAEWSSAKARFLAAGGARAVMSVLCTQDSSDSSGNGTKYSSVDLAEAEEKAATSPSISASIPEDVDKEEEHEEIEIAPEIIQETETVPPENDDESPDAGANRFLTNEDQNLRASRLFVETVRSSMESELSEGRVSHSSEDSECSANEDTDVGLTSAKSRFLQSCQDTDFGPRYLPHHGDELWNTPTIPELPEPLELDSQDEESTSAARDADIDESTSTSSSPSYSSSWYGFLDTDPLRPQRSDLDFDIIDATDIIATPTNQDDTTKEGENEGAEKDPSRRDTDSSASRTPSEAMPEEGQILRHEAADDVLRHQWQLAALPGASPGLSRRALYKTPIVIDNGSEVLKAGLADGALPSVVIPTIAGRLKEDIESCYQHRGDVYVGSQLKNRYGIISVDYPMADGLIDNWADLEHIWDHMITKEVKASWEEHPILISEIALAPGQQREKILEVLFETFKVPACYVVNQGALALHAHGETSGIVMCSGSGVTEMIPIYEGCTMSNAVTSMNVAGKGVTNNLQRALEEERAFTASTASDHRIIREIKENMAYVCKDYETEMSRPDLTLPIQYRLPDGTSLRLQRKDLFHSTEALFKPELSGIAHQHGIIKILKECLERCDPVFLESIDPTLLLTGGNTKLSGFVDRLQLELTKADIKKTVLAPDNRDVTTWIGGAVFAAHSSFQERWIGKHEYEDFGASLAHKQGI